MLFTFLGLIEDLKQHVFGQHIVQQIVPAAVAGSISREQPTKPLVLSFHGWPGGGKNYVASFVVKNYFKEGAGSKFYHFFNARAHFPLEKNTAVYQVAALCIKSFLLFFSYSLHSHFSVS